MSGLQLRGAGNLAFLRRHWLEPFWQRVEDRQRVSVDAKNRGTDDPPKRLASTAVAPAFPPGRSVPFSGSALKNPLNRVFAFDDSPAIIQAGNDAMIIVAFFASADLRGTPRLVM